MWLRRTTRRAAEAVAYAADSSIEGVDVLAAADRLA